MEASAADSVTSIPPAPAGLSSVAVTVTVPVSSAAVSLVASVLRVNVVAGENTAEPLTLMRITNCEFASQPLDGVNDPRILS